MQIYSDKSFSEPIEIIKAEGDLKQAFVRIDELRKKYYLLGYITYDFKKLYFEVFDKFEKYTPKTPKQLGTVIKPLISKETYIKAINKIKEYIANGVTYEVNYTYPSEVLTNLNGLDLYEAILEKQKTLYNAYIETPELTLLSYSPELFFKLKGNKILTKPMKGTAPRLGDEEDSKRREFLFNDMKNRAENIMIVDLLRNDLGRISKTGTVKVDKLFEVEEHPTVFQMTSEISSELEDEINLYDIFEAIFPCGSITGAPKISTMRVIDELEQFNRNIYCGAIGFLSPEVCEFSVPIRILYGKDNKYTYHAGGAIVWDSTAEDEWEETLVKTKFLQTDFQLIETAVDDWARHVLRMKKSAHELGFKWNDEIENLDKTQGLIPSPLEGACITAVCHDVNCSVSDSQKLRITLDKKGNLQYQLTKLSNKKTDRVLSDKKLKDYQIANAPLNDLTSDLLPKVKLLGKVNSHNPFLYHKTTIREAMPTDVFEHIRTNERGEITEGIFTNIAIKKDGKLYTPPVSCGLLNGTFRQKLLKEGKLVEKILYPKDLENADKIFCFNSVRKMVEVQLCL